MVIPRNNKIARFYRYGARRLDPPTENKDHYNVERKHLRKNRSDHCSH